MENDNIVDKVDSLLLKSQSEITANNKGQKAIVAAFLEEVFKRAIEIVKRMEENEDSLSPDLTEEETRYVKEFIKDIFSRALKKMSKYNENGPPLQREEILAIAPEIRDRAIEKLHEQFEKAVKSGITHKYIEAKRRGKAESSNSKTSEPCVEEPYQDSMDDVMVQTEPDQEFITYGGKNSHGYHIIYMNPKKIHRKHEAIKESSQKQMDYLLTLTGDFISEHACEHPFVLVYCCLGEPQAKSMKFQWMVKLYGILRDRKELSRKLLIVTDESSQYDDVTGRIV